MADARFYRNAGPFSLGEIARNLGVRLPDGADAGRVIADLAPLETATPADLSFFAQPNYRRAFLNTQAGACILHDNTAASTGEAPPQTTLLTCATPYRAFGQAVALFYPAAARAGISFLGDSPLRQTESGAHIAADAILEDDVTLQPGALVGARAHIGRGSFIGAHSIVGAGVAIGRDSFLAPHVSLSHALLGDRVVVHTGARIGQDGFGFAMDAQSASLGHGKIPQIGRVVIQDDVEIGANTTIDRGFLGDTVIGAGCKLDNLVQIAHNVVLGRGCVIVAQAGIAGSTRLGETVALGGQAGISGHLRIGSGAQIAAAAGVTRQVEAGEIHAGYPSRPIRQWRREVATLARLAQKDRRREPQG